MPDVGSKDVTIGGISSSSSLHWNSTTVNKKRSKERVNVLIKLAIIVSNHNAF
jgi:hypothetical protein